MFPQLSALIDSGLIEEWAEHVRKNGGPFPKFFVDWIEAEKKATALFYWAPILVPGLLQVEPYARAILETAPDDSESPDVRPARAATALATVASASRWPAPAAP